MHISYRNLKYTLNENDIPILRRADSFWLDKMPYYSVIYSHCIENYYYNRREYISPIKF